MAEIKGVDVSKYQGNIDWAKAKADGVKFAILRAGFGKYSSQKDTTFERNYYECKKHGIDVGCYWYSYATSASEAKLEAEACYQCIKGKQFEYPIYFDYEDPCVTTNSGKSYAVCKQLAKDIIPAFCGALEAKGYFVGLYSFKSMFDYYIPKEHLNRYSIWIAHITSSNNFRLNVNPTPKTTFSPHDMWQYTWRGSVNGIPAGVDLDITVKDFPSIIKKAGLNGFPKNSNSVAKKPETSSKPNTSVNEQKNYSAGTEINLNNTPIYASATTNTASANKTGKYYIYSNVIINGRIRITNLSTNVGKTPVGNYVTGWIKV